MNSTTRAAGPLQGPPEACTRPSRGHFLGLARGHFLGLARGLHGPLFRDLLQGLARASTEA